MKYRYLKNYLYVLPALTLFSMLILQSILKVFRLSFYKWTGAGSKTWVGLANYVRVFSDTRFWLAIKNNALWSILYMIIPLSIGLILAVLITQRKVIASSVFRVVYFIPYVLSYVVVGIIWGWIYHPTFGVINRILQWIGLEAVTRGWLGDRHWALFCVIVAGSWTYYGFCMVIIRSALLDINPSLYDAAKIDGANNAQSFFHITIPSIRSVLSFLLLLSLVNSFRVFDIVYVMTGGGPYNRTEVAALYIYSRAFLQSRVGYSCALSVVFIGIVSIMALGLMRLREDK